MFNDGKMENEFNEMLLIKIIYFHKVLYRKKKTFLMELVACRKINVSNYSRKTRTNYD